MKKFVCIMISCILLLSGCSSSKIALNDYTKAILSDQSEEVLVAYLKTLQNIYIAQTNGLLLGDNTVRANVESFVQYVNNTSEQENTILSFAVDTTKEIIEIETSDIKQFFNEESLNAYLKTGVIPEGAKLSEATIEEINLKIDDLISTYCD